MKRLNTMFLVNVPCLSRPYPLKFFKGCLPQILPGPFLNTLFQMFDSVLNMILGIILGILRNFSHLKTSYLGSCS